MNVLISSNDNYGMPTMVMLTSLVENNPPDSSNRHTVFMLETGLSDEWNGRIESFLTENGWEYKRIRIPGELFSSAKTKPYISKETYYRIVAHKYLPETVNRVLWLDSDIIVRGDLSAFYNTALDGCMTVACSYGPAMKRIIADNAENLKMRCPETYFNAGVMLINLTECRENISEERIERIIYSDEAKSFMFPGQDTVNLLFDGMVQIADYRKYNCMIHCIEGPDDLTYARENALIVHFPGEAKPWRFNDIHFAEEWMQWYHKSFGKSENLKRMSYFRLKALFERQKGQNG